MTAVLKGVNSPPAANAGWQVFAPANTVIAGATFYRKVAFAGTGYGFVERGVTPGAASTYPTIESCSGPNGCAAVMKRTSFAWRSPRADVNRLQAYVQCVPTCQNLTGNAAAVNISRVDIALSDNERADGLGGPDERDVRIERRRQRRAEHRRDVQGRGRGRRVDRRAGRRHDRQRGAGAQLRPAARPIAGSCRAR